ncbi:DJ-1/PfpI family protein [Massilia sp. erpn]|uniref:DJ-1/PfpI family protein n=1 Tax=Massilia sp. erpn TaxID=2738142 RepID=UPI00210712EA|nr:DJ-1/PfpI family protein [Massilia sp. erpn]UTY60261.1 DJ-1/PfpI family protein [Massilia sp. erpn]
MSSEASMPAGAPTDIVMLVYPGMTALDMVAPQLVFSNLPNARVHLVWKNLEAVACDTGFAILPTATLADCPQRPTVLFVPGSKGATWALMQDEEVLDFLRRCGAAADWVSSVCTGSLLLAAAGLLQGYCATSHWGVRELLAEMGATPCDARVVEDRNRLTGGGVTAGMDFALTLAARLYDEPFARILQLLIEYDPQPPFGPGHPQHVDAAVLQSASALYSEEVALAAHAARAAGHALISGESPRSVI